MGGRNCFLRNCALRLPKARGPKAQVHNLLCLSGASSRAYNKRIFRNPWGERRKPLDDCLSEWNERVEEVQEPGVPCVQRVTSELLRATNELLRPICLNESNELVRAPMNSFMSREVSWGESLLSTICLKSGEVADLVAMSRTVWKSEASESTHLRGANAFAPLTLFDECNEE